MTSGSGLVTRPRRALNRLPRPLELLATDADNALRGPLRAALASVGPVNNLDRSTVQDSNQEPETKVTTTY
jgi:hypothetical protein